MKADWRNFSLRFAKRQQPVNAMVLVGVSPTPCQWTRGARVMDCHQPSGEILRMPKNGCEHCGGITQKGLCPCLQCRGKTEAIAPGKPKAGCWVRAVAVSRPKWLSINQCLAGCFRGCAGHAGNMDCFLRGRILKRSMNVTWLAGSDQPYQREPEASPAKAVSCRTPATAHLQGSSQTKRVRDAGWGMQSKICKRWCTNGY